MAQDNTITDEPEINPVTNTLIVPFEDVPASVVPEVEPEETVEEALEETPEATDPFKTETVEQPSLSDKEAQVLRTGRAELARERLAFEQERASLEQTKGRQDRMARYTERHGEEAAREMVQDQMADKAVYDAEIGKLQTAQRFNEEKQRGVAELAKQYGVDPEYLAKFDTRSSMEVGAIERAARIKDRADNLVIQEGFEKRLKVMEEGKVEDGAFDSAAPSGSVPLSAAQLLQKSGADPGFDMTEAQHKLVNEHLGIG